MHTPVYCGSREISTVERAGESVRAGGSEHWPRRLEVRRISTYRGRYTQVKFYSVLTCIIVKSYTPEWDGVVCWSGPSDAECVGVTG